MDQAEWKELKKSTCIAVTGGIATGKSTVCSYLTQQGYLVVDADKLSRDAIAKGSPGFQQVISAFGSGILDPTGDIDRAKLGQLVFSSSEDRKKLEAIIHPELDQLTQRAYEAGITASKPADIWFYEASLVFEKHLESHFRAVWLTDCSEKSQLQRLMERNKLSQEAALARIASQMPLAIKRTLADRIINTDTSLDRVFQSVDSLLQESMLV